jgi:hypothetical protein
MKFLTVDQLEKLKVYSFLIQSAELAKEQHDLAAEKAIEAKEWLDIARNSVDALSDLFPANMEATLKAFGLKNADGNGHKIILDLLDKYMQKQTIISPTLAEIRTKRDVVIRIGR